MNRCDCVESVDNTRDSMCDSDACNVDGDEDSTIGMIIMQTLFFPHTLSLLNSIKHPF